MTHPDAPVPEQVACLLWKCHSLAIERVVAESSGDDPALSVGDRSVTWHTLQPIERAWWIRTAENLEGSAWWQETVAQPYQRGADEGHPHVCDYLEGIKDEHERLSRAVRAVLDEWGQVLYPLLRQRIEAALAPRADEEPT